MIWIKNKKGKRKTEKKRKKQIKSAQNTIPYIRSFDDGMFEIKRGVYSKSFFMADINYQTAREDEQEAMFMKYCSFLNSFNSSVEVQITVNNKSINKETFKEKIFIKDKDDNLEVYRKEFNQVLADKIGLGKNNIRKEKYLTLTITADEHEHAVDTMQRLEIEATTALKKVGSNLEAMDIEKRLEVLHDIYRNSHVGEFGLNPQKINKSRGMDTKDLIAPDGIEFKLDHMIIGDKHAQVMFIKDYPTFLTDKILNDLTDFRFNMCLSLNFDPLEPNAALKLVNKQITGMEANKMQHQKKGLQSGYIEAFIPYNLRFALKEAQELLDDLQNKDQKLFLVSIVIFHMADTLEELKKQHELIASAARKNMCQVGITNLQQEEGLKNALPFGVNTLSLDRCLTTESTAIFIPFNTKELMHDDGIFYGLNAVTNNLIMFNRKRLKAPNGFYLGKPGSGKSFLSKLEMIYVLLTTDDDIIIIDPEREYTKVVQNFGGEVIHVSASSKNYINPMDISLEYGDDDDPLMLKSDFILSLCEVILGGKKGLDPVQIAIVDRCVKLTYQDMKDKGYDKAFTPTLVDFYEVMKQQPEEEAKKMATALELYAKGNLKVFSNLTNIDVENRIICYDTKDLGKQLKSMGMLIVLDAIWNRVSINREKGRRTWLYIDEMYIFFSSDYLASFFDEVYRRFRKWGGIPTGITQNIKPMLEYPAARTMLSNSDFVVLLNQSPVDQEALADLYKISESQLSYVADSDAGHGLLYTEGNIIPFKNLFPKNTQIYRMITTKIEEITADKEDEKTWTA